MGRRSVEAWNFLTALVGHGLTAAAQGVPLLLDQMLKQGNRSGEASAPASNGWRVMWLREACVKDSPGWAESVHRKA